MLPHQDTFPVRAVRAKTFSTVNIYTHYKTREHQVISYINNFIENPEEKK